MKAVALLAVAIATSASASQHAPQTEGQANHPHVSANPYADMKDRRIKALSSRQLDDLRAGRGMSMALPAELNGWPGPAHVLELADRLGLSADQRQRTQALFDRMQRQARELGEQLIEAESELDRLFKERTASAARIDEATAAAAQRQGRLRAAHLHYHLAMRGLLSEVQVAQYNRLRGYRR